MATKGLFICLRGAEMFGWHLAKNNSDQLEMDRLYYFSYMRKLFITRMYIHNQFYIYSPNDINNHTVDGKILFFHLDYWTIEGKY